MSKWIAVEDQLPIPMQPVWCVDKVHRADFALAIYYGPQKGFVFIDEDALNGAEPTHWTGVRGPRPLPKKR